MKKNKKPIIIGVIIISIVLLVAGILLWYFAGEDKEKQSTESHKVPMTQEGVFPYQIPNTSLVIQKVRSYDGVFIEDGSDRNVSGISASQTLARKIHRVFGFFINFTKVRQKYY